MNDLNLPWESSPFWLLTEERWFINTAFKYFILSVYMSHIRWPLTSVHLMLTLVIARDDNNCVPSVVRDPLTPAITFNRNKSCYTMSDVLLFWTLRRGGGQSYNLVMLTFCSLSGKAKRQIQSQSSKCW